MFSHQPPWTSISEEEETVQTPAKFNIGDCVCWCRVPSRDFGIIVERFYGAEGSIKALGWHYTIQLDPDSPSFDHCKIDYGFEDDLSLIGRGGADAVE
jgi:hypothetical protein